MHDDLQRWHCPYRAARGRLAIVRHVERRATIIVEDATVSERGTTGPGDQKRQEAIQKRAHALWQEQGQPQGMHEVHWQQAEREHDQRDGSASAPDAPRSERNNAG
jgi:hypothetical protein